MVQHQENKKPLEPVYFGMVQNQIFMMDTNMIMRVKAL